MKDSGRATQGTDGGRAATGPGATGKLPGATESARSVQVFVQLVWTLNPGLNISSGHGQNVMLSPFVGLRSGYSSRCLFSASLCMDVFVAVCFYPPDNFLILVMISLPYEIKQGKIPWKALKQMTLSSMALEN
jgi:hypothetical protein